jgi:hypothetical protein
MTQVSAETLFSLHTSLHSRFQKYNLNLQAVPGCESILGGSVQTVAYMRPTAEAQTVESLMGRDYNNRRIEMRRHPVIELRAHGNGLVLEFILPPDAWIDQQNFVGKMSIERHRTAFRRMIAKLDDGYSLGFWSGIHLDPHHLSPAKAAHSIIFDPWINTFCCGQDWLRIGCWREDVHNPADLSGELFQRAQSLYDIYTFIGWTSNNNYRSFQPEQARPANRLGSPVYA